MSDEPDRARFLQGLGRALRQPWRLNQTTRLALDSLAQRYAAQRGLCYQPTGETPPATWFLETVQPRGSHSVLRGSLAGGIPGALFYAERRIPVKRGQVTEGWTVALYELPIAATLGIACLFRPGVAWGGRRTVPVAVPRGLIEVSLGDATLDGRFLVAVSEEHRAAVTRLFTAEFIAWMNGLPGKRTGEAVTRFELRNGVLCVYAKPKARTKQALDAFCERAAHVAARIVAAGGAGTPAAS